MKFLVCYDVPENKVRTKIVKCLRKVAYRLQYSVFLGEGQRKDINQLQKKLGKIVSKSSKARILVMPVNENELRNLWAYGTFLEDKKEYFIA